MEDVMLKKITALSLAALISPSAYGWDGLDKGGEAEEAMHLTPDLKNGEEIYRICAFCHTIDGWGMEPGIGRYRTPGIYPQLSGQHQSVLIKQLSDIRQLNRDNPTMYPFTLPRYIGGTQDVADVTAYITTLPINKHNKHGNGNDLKLGKELYEKNCARCHGENGEGDAENFYPVLSNQHYPYMLRQFIWIKDGKRRNANRKMVQQIQRFTYRDIKAVVDYSSRLDAGWITQQPTN